MTFGEVYRRIYVRKSCFTALLTRRRKTKFPTVYPTIYLPKWQIWIQLSPNFISKLNDWLWWLNLENYIVLGYFSIYMHSLNFMLIWVELRIKVFKPRGLISIKPRHMSRVIIKPVFCICENKDTDQLHGNREAYCPLCFRYLDSTIPLLPRYKISSL